MGPLDGWNQKDTYAFNDYYAGCDAEQKADLARAFIAGRVSERRRHPRWYASLARQLGDWLFAIGTIGAGLIVLMIFGGLISGCNDRMVRENDKVKNRIEGYGAVEIVKMINVTHAGTFTDGSLRDFVWFEGKTEAGELVEFDRVFTKRDWKVGDKVNLTYDQSTSPSHIRIVGRAGYKIEE